MTLRGNTARCAGLFSTVFLELKQNMKSSHFGEREQQTLNHFNLRAA